MYTQCPDCSTAFRVTADVLRQAAGKVRCGGCGNAFSALEYLSETMPEETTPAETEEHLPELTPEKPETPESDDGTPESISAEQSAALLKTLDELAGSDIRIEDTGVEWRVMEDDEIGAAADDDIAVDVPVEDQPEVDELLEASPTPVDQFLTNTPPEVDAPEIFEEDTDAAGKTPVEELRFDDNTPLPEDFGLEDDDDDAVVVAPAVEDDEPVEIVEDDELEEIVEDDPQGDIDLSQPDEWTDILDEFEGLGESVSEQTIADELDALVEEEFGEDEPYPAVAEEPVAAPEDPESEPPDVDTQFALQAEALGLDVSGVNETPEFPENTGSEVDLDALIDESKSTKRDVDELLDEDLVDDGTVGELDVELELADDEDDAADDHFVPPMSEEEQTINMQIDQDLLAVAVTDEDGFASTIVIPEEDAVATAFEDTSVDKAEDAPDGKAEDDAGEALKETDTGFETIIMEGEHVRSALEEDHREAHREAAAASLAAAERPEAQAVDDGKRKYGLIAAAVALILVFAGQAVHQSRDALATIPAFNDIVGPMYRALGKPLSPEWDITAWRFEVTKGSTDEANENLTIYSRLGNKSDTALPYPLIGISLTDRFEETIGSRVLDPAEYLASDLDPRKLVAAGNTFNAVMTIPSPSDEATGFKLNVCYRESSGNLRCAIDDFK